MGFSEGIQGLRAAKSQVVERIEKIPVVESFLYNRDPNNTSWFGLTATAISSFMVRRELFAPALVASAIGTAADLADGEQAERQGSTSKGGYIDAVFGDKAGEILRISAMRAHADKKGWKATARLAAFAEVLRTAPATFRSIAERENKIGHKTGEGAIQVKEQGWGTKLACETAIHATIGAPKKGVVWPVAMTYLTVAPITTAYDRMKLLLPKPLTQLVNPKSAVPSKLSLHETAHVRNTILEIYGKQLLTRLITSNPDSVAFSGLASYSKVKAETSIGERTNWGAENLVPHALILLTKILAGDKLPKNYGAIALAVCDGLTLLSSFKRVHDNDQKSPPRKGKLVDVRC